MTDEDIARLRTAAWKARENARTYSGVKVGAAVLTDAGEVYSGCNAEHRFRSHDIHAEVNAIGTFVAQSRSTIRAVMVVSEESFFTPCGGCMDWILEHGGPNCMVLVASSAEGPLMTWHAHELMPHYPHRGVVRS